MDIEELVEKHIRRNGWSFSHDGECADTIRAALTELSETHAIEMRAYEATVENLEAKVRELESGMVPDGWQLVPVEPTPDMIDAVLGYANGNDLKLLGADLLRIEIWHDWRAMLAAAQQPKKEGE